MAKLRPKTLMSADVRFGSRVRQSAAGANRRRAKSNGRADPYIATRIAAATAKMTTVTSASLATLVLGVHAMAPVGRTVWLIVRP